MRKTINFKARQFFGVVLYNNEKKTSTNEKTFKNLTPKLNFNNNIKYIKICI